MNAGTHQAIFHGNLKISLLVWYMGLLFLVPLSSYAQEDPTGQLVIKMLDNFQKILPFHLAYSQQILTGKDAGSLKIDASQNWKESLKLIQDLLEVEYRIVGDQLILFPKKRFLIQGFIYDENTGESLPGAHILLQQNHLGAVSNESGYYQLLVSEGEQKIVASYLGYEAAVHELSIHAPTQLDLKLKSALELPEIIVREETSTQDFRYQTEGEKIPLSQLEAFPSIGANMDITRYLQLSPGVQTGGDGFGGLHVRGGNADQNLILLEEIPIYNPFHLFGVSSIFNGDVIQSARFSNSYFSPANDGRLSSVLQITVRDGHRYKTSIRASAGILGTYLVLETPLFKNKGTLMLAGQRSHIGNILQQYSRTVKLDAENDGYFKPKFHDIYGKALITLGRSDRLIFNAYAGSDTHLDINRYNFDDRYLDQYRDEYYWGNMAAGIKWLHEINGRAFLKINAYHSRYRYQSINAYLEKIITNQQTYSGIHELTEFRSSIKETGIKSDVSFLTGFHHIKTGLNLATHEYIPGVVAYSDEQDPEPLFSIESDLPQLADSLFDVLSFRSSQASVFLEDHWDLAQQWKINGGFNAQFFNTNEQSYFALQPRFNLIHEFKSQSLALSINKLFQPQHLITANDNGLPNELWVPASRNIRPQNSWNLDLTWTYLLSEKTNIKSSIYYKKMKGLITFQDDPGYLSYGSLDNVDASVWESDILTGDGESWGIETSFSHRWTRLSCQLNYTFLKSSRYFSGKNLGYVVPYEFEVPHTVNIIGLWEFNKHFNIGFTWQLSSGTRYNLIPGIYDLYDKSEYFLDQFMVEDQNLDLLIMPIYHRLDLSASFTIDRSDKIKHQFKLSLLNLYDRRNIIFPRIYRGDPTDIRFSEGLPFIPSLSYHFSFN